MRISEIKEALAYAKSLVDDEYKYNVCVGTYNNYRGDLGVCFKILLEGRVVDTIYSGLCFKDVESLKKRLLSQWERIKREIL